MQKYIRPIIKFLVFIGIITLAISYFWRWIMAWLGIMIPPQWDAAIQIATMTGAILIVFFMYKDKLKYGIEKILGYIGNVGYKISKANRSKHPRAISDKQYKLIAFIVPILFAIVFSLTQYTFLVEVAMNEQIARQFTSGNQNAFIFPTANPEYNKTSRQYPYSLLVEFGVNYTETITDVFIKTENEIKVTKYFWGKPRQTDEVIPDVVSINASRGSITIASLGGATPEITTHSFSYEVIQKPINTDFSFYVYLESSQPFNEVEAQFDDAVLVLREGQIQVPSGQ